MRKICRALEGYVTSFQDFFIFLRTRQLRIHLSHLCSQLTGMEWNRTSEVSTAGLCKESQDYPTTTSLRSAGPFQQPIRFRVSIYPSPPFLF